MGTKSYDCPFDVDEDRLAVALYDQAICKPGSGFGSRSDATRVAQTMIRAIEIVNKDGTIEHEEVRKQLDEAGDRVIMLEDEVKRLSTLLEENGIKFEEV